MPAIDLRDIKIAKYTNTAGTVAYSDAQSVGEAMTANLELRYAEGRLYAESRLAEYIKKATGGTISIGVKYIPTAAQKVLFGSTEVERTIGSGSSSVTLTSLAIGSKSVPNYVGVAFYAPDMVDGVEKYTGVFVHKALFGPPSYAYNTMGESINFNTPTTSGEFLATDATGNAMVEVVTLDTENDAKSWVNLVLGVTT